MKISIGNDHAGPEYKKAIVEIYNQWGELIYVSEEGYPKAWDGTHNGAPASTGTYFYIVYPNLEGHKNKSGYLTLIR